MMAGDQVSGDAQVLSVLADRTPLLRRLHGDGGVDDVPPLFDLDGLDVEIPEHVRDVLDRLLVENDLGHANQTVRMFDSPGLITATAATENGTPQAAPRSTFVPPKRNRRTSPRFRVASSGQFEARTTSFAFFDFAARRTSRMPKRTSPVSAATRRARGTSITGRPLPGAPRGPARGPAASRRVSAWRRPSASRPPEAACRSG